MLETPITVMEHKYIMNHKNLMPLKQLEQEQHVMTFPQLSMSSFLDISIRISCISKMITTALHSYTYNPCIINNEYCESVMFKFNTNNKVPPTGKSRITN